MFLSNSKKTKNFLKQWKKIHLLDVFFVGAFLVLVSFFIIIFARSDKNINVTVKVTDQNIFYIGTQAPNEYIYSFNQGDVERNEVGKVTAEIKNIRRFQSNPDSYTMYMDLSIKVNYNPLKKEYSYKGRPIIFGQDLQFDFSNTKVEGIVTDFPQFVKPKRTPVTILAETQLRADSRSYSDTYGMPQFFDHVIKVGDTIKDNQGQEIIKVTGTRSSPAKRTIVTANNQSVTIDDRELLDIFYTLEIKAYEIDGKTYLYDYMPLQVGSSVPLILKDVSLWPTITSFRRL